MLRRSLWVSAMMLAGSGLLAMSGCAEQGPKTGGVTTVSPGTKPGTAPAAPTDDKAKATEPATATDTPPAGADVPSTSTDTRTSDGGTETPSTPGNGQ